MVYTSRIWLRKICSIELLGVGVKALVSRAPPSRLVWKLWEDKGSQALGQEVLKSFSPSADLYIYIFPSLCVKWKHKIKRKKITGTNGYMNMILFVKIKNFLVTCVSRSK